MRLFPILAILATLFTLAHPAAAADTKAAALVIDANTGRVLYEQNADAKRYPASLTKMMTLYVLFEELDAKRLTLTTKLSVSANAARQAPSKLGLKAGSTIKVEDAILALVTKSANDVAVVVAENIGGSVSAFAGRMNRAAKALGMRSTTFRNPHGLPDSGQVTTARDLSRLALALQDRFPTYYGYFSKRSFTYRGAKIRNHNRLLGSVDGVDGIKTGYTRASGFNLVTNVNRDDRHIIAVVLGGKTASSRDARMRELIAKYIKKAKRGDRSPALLVADTGAGTTPAIVADGSSEVADARTPRARPEGETGPENVLAYAADEQPRDIIASAMAELEAIEGDFSDGEDAAEARDDDPIASRIESASAVAEFADIEVQGGSSDPIAKLTQMARIRAGVADVVAAPAAAIAGTSGPSGWHIQIGAVPTQAGAEALIEKAQSRMGTVLASLQPLTLEVDRDGSTLYRARFAGFSDKDEARAACVQLKRKDFSCLAVPN